MSAWLKVQPGKKRELCDPCTDLLQLVFLSVASVFLSVASVFLSVASVFLSVANRICYTLHCTLTYTSPSLTLCFFVFLICMLVNNFKQKLSFVVLSILSILIPGSRSLYQRALQQLYFEPPHPMQSRCFLSHFVVSICFTFCCKGSLLVVIQFYVPLMSGVTRTNNKAAPAASKSTPQKRGIQLLTKTVSQLVQSLLVV